MSRRKGVKVVSSNGPCFADCAVCTAWARLQNEGAHLASVSTFYPVHEVAATPVLFTSSSIKMSQSH